MSITYKSGQTVVVETGVGHVHGIMIDPEPDAMNTYIVSVGGKINKITGANLSPYIEDEFRFSPYRCPNCAHDALACKPGTLHTIAQCRDCGAEFHWTHFRES